MRHPSLLATLCFLALLRPASALDAFPDPGSGRPPLAQAGLALRLRRSGDRIEAALTVRLRAGAAPAAGAWLIAPLPPGVRLDPDALRVDGRVTPFDFLRPPQATPAAFQLAAELNRPEALAAADRPFLRAVLRDVAPQAELRVELDWTLPVDPETSRLDLRIPLVRPGAEVDADAPLSISGQIAGPPGGLRLLLSPTHPVVSERVDASTVRFEAAGRLRASPPDLQIIVRFTPDPVAFHLIPYKASDEEGSCLYALSGSENAVRLPAFRRDVVLAVDRSTSLAGPRLAAVDNAVRAAIETLSPDDRFALLTFETRVAVWPPGLGPASPERREAALTWLGERKALGGCALSETLDRAFELLDDSDRYPIVVLFLDGLPTVGITKLEEFIARVAARQEERTRARGIGLRLAAFALGPDVNPRFLDRLVAALRGWRHYPENPEALERETRNLLRLTRRPLLAEIQLAWTGGAAPAEGVMTEPLVEGPPDLFEDRPLAILARYRQPGFHFLSLTGRGPSGDGVVPRSFAFSERLPDVDRSAPDIPRLWAARSLARRWDRVRLGLDRLTDAAAAEALRRRFGLRFPWLPPETDDAPPDAVPALYARAAAALAGRASRSGLPEMRDAGPLPARESRLLWTLQYDLPSVADLERLTPDDAPAPVAIGETIFLPRGGRWVDAEIERLRGLAKAALPAPDCSWTAASEEFWRGVAERPGLAPYLSVGDDLLFLRDGLLYRVTPHK